MKVIIPCCDDICYVGSLPRFMSPDANGMPLVLNITSSLTCDCEDIIICVQSKHSEFVQPLMKLMPGITVCVINKPCRNQCETVIEAINTLGIADSIFVKDGDSSFDIDSVDDHFNYVCVETLNNHKTNVNDKSYVATDHNDFIVNMKEKNIISHLFSVGGYYFCDSNAFIQHYLGLTQHMPEWQNRIYISDVISTMILHDFDFVAKKVENYKDYGTLEEWKYNVNR